MFLGFSGPQGHRNIKKRSTKIWVPRDPQKTVRSTLLNKRNFDKGVSLEWLNLPRNSALKMTFFPRTNLGWGSGPRIGGSEAKIETSGFKIGATGANIGGSGVRMRASGANIGSTGALIGGSGEKIGCFDAKIWGSRVKIGAIGPRR